MKRKEFGFWKEQGKNYSDEPSIKDYISVVTNQDKEKIVAYLNAGGNVCVTSALAFPNVITGETGSGSIAIKTDGEWSWLESLADYVANHHVSIPEEWYEYMKQHDFKITQEIKDRNPEVAW